MVKNALWNLFGFGFPLCIAVWAVPILLHGYGDERFGLISIVWALIGYFSIFDLGMGRALTKIVSQKLGEGKDSDIPNLVKTALIVIAGLGVVACLVGFFSAEWLIRTVLAVRRDYEAEGIDSMRVMSFALPFVVLSAALIGLLEAHAQFKSITVVRLFMGAGNFAGPVFALWGGYGLIGATAVLVVVRVLTTSFFYYQCKRYAAFGSSSGVYKKDLVPLLFRFGAWITVSNVLSPVMVQLDKLIIGSVVSVASLPYYAVPADVVNRLSFIPSSIVGVLFPSFSRIWAENSERGGKVFDRSCILVLLVILPVSVLMLTFAEVIMTKWMGGAFSEVATPIVICMSLGFFLNGMARVPNSLIQSVGRPDVTAKLHFIEFPVYIIGLYFLLSWKGVFGAALAWTARMALDMILHYWAASKISSDVRRYCIKNFLAVGVSLFSLLLVLFSKSMEIGVSLFVVCVCVLALYARRIRG